MSATSMNLHKWYYNDSRVLQCVVDDDQDLMKSNDTKVAHRKR